MAKSRHIDDEDEDDNFDDMDLTDNYSEEIEEEIEEEIKIDLDDEDELDIIIEIDDEDDENSSSDGVYLSKHKEEGKHSLKYDSIFKGKKEEPVDEDDLDGFSLYYKDTIEVDKSSNYYFESIDNENYIRSKLVKDKVYKVLENNTNLSFLNSRRKPSRIDFNNYFNLLKIHLVDESFTNTELFCELAYYFSDNIFNIFKLLDNKWRNLIINELQNHIGKSVNSKEITNRNIYEGTEIEFNWFGDNGSNILITGVVTETDYQNSSFKVDSYENIYDVELNKITKILNNTKFKYNLNKLNNIDFL